MDSRRVMHKPSFWNGWDFKTLLTYALIIGGFVIGQMRADIRMDAQLQYITETQKEIKETIKRLWEIIGTTGDRVTGLEERAKSDKEILNRHDKKIYNY